MTKPRNDERPSFASGPSLEAMYPAVASIAEFNGKTILGWMTLHQEWTGFLMHRVQKEVALAQRLATCSGPLDMYGVYTEFYQQAFADYQREFGEMMRLGQTSLSDAQNTIETTMRDTPRAAA